MCLADVQTLGTSSAPEFTLALTPRTSFITMVLNALRQLGSSIKSGYTYCATPEVSTNRRYATLSSRQSVIFVWGIVLAGLALALSSAGQEKSQHAILSGCMAVAVLAIACNVCGIVATCLEKPRLAVVYIIFSIIMALALGGAALSGRAAMSRFDYLITLIWQRYDEQTKIQLQNAGPCCGLLQFNDQFAVQPCPGNATQSCNIIIFSKQKAMLYLAIDIMLFSAVGMGAMSLVVFVLMKAIKAKQQIIQQYSRVSLDADEPFV